jgi:hypothetical protein
VWWSILEIVISFAFVVANSVFWGYLFHLGPGVWRQLSRRSSPGN